MFFFCRGRAPTLSLSLLLTCVPSNRRSRYWEMAGSRRCLVGWRKEGREEREMGHRRRNEGERGRTPWPAPRAPVPPPRTLRICAIATCARVCVQGVLAAEESARSHTGVKEGASTPGRLCAALSQPPLPFFVSTRKIYTRPHAPKPTLAQTNGHARPLLAHTHSRTRTHKKELGNARRQGMRNTHKKENHSPPLFFFHLLSLTCRPSRPRSPPS